MTNGLHTLVFFVSCPRLLDVACPERDRMGKKSLFLYTNSLIDFDYFQWLFAPLAVTKEGLEFPTFTF
jgi:hypothetical protein